MKYIFLIAIFLTTLAKGEMLFNGLGKIDVYPIKMSITVTDNGEVTGNYLYPRTNIPIALKGNILKDELSLQSVSSSKVTETFKGKVIFYKNEIISIEGKWLGAHVGELSGDYKDSDGYNFNVDVEYEVNPLGDNKVTCDEMEMYPHKVFKLGDLGSGHGSPNEVDYSCPKSLSKLDFLQGLIGYASFIRAPSPLPRQCTGSIIHAQWRYYHFSLAELGYYPQGHTPRKRGKTKGMEYFEEWSYHSLYNRNIYNNFFKEIENVRPKLIDWYVDIHSVSLKVAEKYTANALQNISNYGFGSYFYSWKPEPLIPNTEQATEGDFSDFLTAIPNASEKQKFNSLRRLVTHQASNDMIQILLSSMTVKAYDEKSESMLSNAVNNPLHIKTLLEAGFHVDHQNSFGKTALYYAIQFNQHDSVELLLNHGANVNHVYQQGETNSWCPSSVTFGRTPLMHAAQHSDISMLKLLLKYGANLYSENALGAKALDYAIRDKKEENVAFLVKEVRSNIPEEVKAEINRFNLLGEKEYKKGHYVKAKEFFLKAIELDQTDVNIKLLNNLAITTIKLKDYAIALEASERVISLAKGNKTLASAYFNYGKACKLLRSEGKSNFVNGKQYCPNSSLKYFVEAFEAYPTQSRAGVVIENIKSKTDKKLKFLHTISCYKNGSNGVEAARVIGSYLYILAAHNLNYEDIRFTVNESAPIFEFEPNNVHKLSDSQYLHVLVSPDKLPKDVLIGNNYCKRVGGGADTFSHPK